GRAHEAADDPEDETGDENRPEDGDAGDRIGTTVKNLRHYSLDLGRARSYRNPPSSQPQTLETPPDTIRAMMLALLASSRSTRLRGTTTSVPAMLYENGK